MKLGLISAVSAVVAAVSITGVTAQGQLAPPTNVRIITGGDSTPTPPPPPPPSGPAPTPCEVPAPSGKSAHAYFDSLVRRSEHLCNWSLRSQAQLDSLVASKPSTYFTYDPSRDSYSGAQDAAKFYVPAGLPSSNIPTTKQLRLPIKNTNGGTLLFTWDWYWGPEFLTQRGGMNHYKVFKFIEGGHSLWTLMHSPAWAESGEIAKVWDSFATPSGAPDGMINREPFTPTGPGTPDQRHKSGQQVGIKANTWMRYWVEFKLYQPHTAFTEWNQVTGQTLRPNPNDPYGRWHMVSMWFADENRGPMRMLYRIPVGWSANWNPYISHFYILMNTSQTSGFIGPWVGYGRNVVVLHNYQLPSVPENDKFLFQRPVR